MERESVERDLQKGEYPITAFCTSTLELGIDIGKVKSIAQIGTATSISGLRQRLGRSGRRNEPSILRVFSIEKKDDGLSYNLRTSLVRKHSKKCTLYAVGFDCSFALAITIKPK